MGTDRRPISARALIVGAILGVAALGLTTAGTSVFLVQRDRVIGEVDERLISQIHALREIAVGVDPEGDSETVSAAASAAGLAESTLTDSATIGASIDTGRFATVPAFLRAVVLQMMPGPHEGAVAIVDGQVTSRSSALVGVDISQETGLIERAIAATAGSPRAVLGTVRVHDTSFRYLAVPIARGTDADAGADADADADTGADAGIYLRAVDLSAELAPVSTSLSTYTLAALATLAATGIVGWFVAGRVLSPIRQLREATESITIADLSARIPAPGHDDIADLTRTVNSMLDRLERSLDGQRQLLDDVRHELKTPITIVRGHLETMDAADPDDVRATREIGIAELDRLTRLVEDIDLLSSVEADQFSMHPTDLTQLTERISDLVAAIPDHEWSIAATARGAIDADGDRLLQAWLQLADNAAKYSPAGSPITLGSAIDAREARLWVADRGPGIPPAARHRIFRRFDRAGVRRSVGGSGLGLAIVDAIASAHSGSCRVTDTPGGGATFTIHLPVAISADAGSAVPRDAGDVVPQRETSP